ncbi:MAG: hypothetical protein ACI9ON_000891 [Limisphaerales bacterium]|jgi:hypothetical protein
MRLRLALLAVVLVKIVLVEIVFAPVVLAQSMPLSQEVIVPVVVDESLRSALDRFASYGLNIVSTSWTVPARLAVTQLPPSSASINEQVGFLLASHNLHLVLVDDNNGFVAKNTDQPSVRKPAAEARVVAPAIEEVVVFAHYRIDGLTVHSRYTDRHDLAAIPSIGRDALRSLNTLPGAASSGISARQRYRGGNGDETLYLLDGVELTSPFHFEGFHELFSVINPNIVESGEAYLSGYPVSFESKLSGVVDLRLVDPRLVEREDSVQANVDLNFFSAAADARGSAKNWTWLVSGRKSLIDLGLKQLDRDYGVPKFHDEIARAEWSGEGETHIVGLLNSADKLTLRDDESGERAAAELEHQILWWRWLKEFNDVVSVVSQISWTRGDVHRRGTKSTGEQVHGRLSEGRDYTQLGFKNTWEFQRSPAWLLSAGWSYAKHEADFDYQLLANYEPHFALIQPIDTLVRDVKTDRSGETYSLFLSSTHQLGKLSMTAGMRFDGQDIDPVHVNQVSVRGSFNYQMAADLDFYLDLGRYTQQQQLHELQLDDGNLELDAPQHSDQVNLGVHWLPGPWSLRLEGYFRRIGNPWSRAENIYNPWVLLPEVQGDRYLVSPTDARSRGAEFSAKWSLTETLLIKASYAYGNSIERVGGRWKPRPWQQRNTYRAGMDWRPGSWIIGLQLTHRSGWQTTNFVDDSSQLVSTLNRQELPDYTSIDLHVSWTRDQSWGNWLAYLDISNLSDRKNVGGYDYQTASSRTPQHLLPLTPTLGIRITWN